MQTHGLAERGLGGCPIRGSTLAAWGISAPSFERSRVAYAEVERAVRSSVLVRHLEDLLSRVVANEIRMIGGDVRLDVLDQRVVGLAFDVFATRTVDNFH